MKEKDINLVDLLKLILFLGAILAVKEILFIVLLLFLVN